eukprot:TRINITY_DN4253_c0_g2_i6.p1 TRINITY_DN4253_c0_g2~~TRINITY_DN4253_c0_g2_i6.p1  ORF type:complete len:525 (-),score=72.49 TRINITY_DN4253_c0_g2_i6:1443-3017(-)
MYRTQRGLVSTGSRFGFNPPRPANASTQDSLTTNMGLSQSLAAAKSASKSISKSSISSAAITKLPSVQVQGHGQNMYAARNSNAKQVNASDESIHIQNGSSVQCMGAGPQTSNATTRLPASRLPSTVSIPSQSSKVASSKAEMKGSRIISPTKLSPQDRKPSEDQSDTYHMNEKENGTHGGEAKKPSVPEAKPRFCSRLRPVSSRSSLSSQTNTRNNSNLSPSPSQSPNSVQIHASNQSEKSSPLVSASSIAGVSDSIHVPAASVPVNIMNVPEADEAFDEDAIPETQTLSQTSVNHISILHSPNAISPIVPCISPYRAMSSTYLKNTSTNSSCNLTVHDQKPHLLFSCLQCESRSGTTRKLEMSVQTDHVQSNSDTSKKFKTSTIRFSTRKEHDDGRLFCLSLAQSKVFVTLLQRQTERFHHFLLDSYSPTCQEYAVACATLINMDLEFTDKIDLLQILNDVLEICRDCRLLFRESAIQASQHGLNYSQGVERSAMIFSPDYASLGASVLVFVVENILASLVS